MAHKATKKVSSASPLMVRLDDDTKACLAQAAALRRISVSDYVRTVTVAQARREVRAARQVDFGDLPAEISKLLPRRLLPVAVLAWLGVSAAHQGRGLGRLLVAQALRDCYEAGKSFPFVAAILDCLNDKAKAFYRQWD